jgi:hypothetical protein
MDIMYIFGATGTGKSHYVDKEAGPAAYWKDGGSKWFHGYEGEENVVIDEYRSGFPYGVFLQLLDKYPIKVEVKGGMPEFVAKKVWITSNLAPYELYPNVTDKSHLYRRLDGCVWHIYKGATGQRYIVPCNKDGTHVYFSRQRPLPEDRPEEPVAQTLAELRDAPTPIEADVCMCDLLNCGEQNAQCMCGCHDDDSDGETQQL